VQGGQPVIVGTRLDVATLAAYHNMGYSVEKLLKIYAHIAPAQMYDAISFYYDHKDEIEASFEEDRKSEAEHEARKAEYLSRRPAR
jgi:uncharacterized protein (DUF433 family)